MDLLDHSYYIVLLLKTTIKDVKSVKQKIALYILVKSCVYVKRWSMIYLQQPWFARLVDYDVKT